MAGDTRSEQIALSLRAEERCARTGAPMRGQCGGHTDFHGWGFVWTRHFVAQTRYRVVPYDHPAPEVIHDQRA